MLKRCLTIETNKQTKIASNNKIIFNWRHTNAPKPAWCDIDIYLGAIYDYVLNDTEVKWLYYAGKNRYCHLQPTPAPTI